MSIHPSATKCEFLSSIMNGLFEAKVCDDEERAQRCKETMHVPLVILTMGGVTKLGRFAMHVSPRMDASL